MKVKGAWLVGFAVLCVGLLAVAQAGDRKEVLAGVFLADADDFHQGSGGHRNFRARLSGFSEVPAFVTSGSGRFNARLDVSGGQASALHYTLQYSLEGDVLQAHIHIGQAGVNGAVTLFLCSNLASAPAGVPACEGPNEGMVSGTLTDSNVIAVQGVDNLDDVVRAIRAGAAYVNVHSSLSPPGEVRGQIRRGGGPGHEDGDDDDDDD